MMARPNPNTFEKNSPMSPQSAGSNISYQTNVNRQKTKKWAEAKPANYGGDDWGDEYDYDYDPPPPPVAKPTGLRQQGQAMQNPTKAESPVVDNSKKYGELPPLPGASKPRERLNSFDAEDEKRNFSNSTVRQPSPSTAKPSPSGPATRFSQITGVPTVRNTNGPPLHISTQSATQAPSGLRKASQVVSPISESPHPDILQPGRANTGEESPAATSPIISPNSDTRTPSSDYQARRDFSPSAVPPPLVTRASPTPQSATDSPTTRFPARKSSLSQTGAPELTEITGPHQAQAAPKPWTAPRSASPGPSGRSPATPTGKALPFIRPADIYQRIEEERERERQSLDSGRPSMDLITGAKSSERSDSPAKSHLREKSSSDSLGGRRSRASLEGDDASESGRLRPMLEPVKERKSEYGFESFNVNDQAPQQESESNEPVRDTTIFWDDHLDVEEARRHSTSPKLPDLNRISGFGMDMFSQSKPDDSFLSATRDTETTPTGSSTAQVPMSNTEDLTLRNQPSFGFKSVVQQAFDRVDDSSVPNTPASQANSGVRRTDSESTGTDGISPIMSRVPSAAVRDRTRDPSNPSILEVVNEPVSPEEPSEQIERENHPESVPEGPPLDFTPGYRRDISPPSRENSPARHPDVAKTKILPSAQHADVSETSPNADDEPFQPPRPIFDREQSFRPALPGGWTSYATSAESEAAMQSVERTQTPVSEVSPVQESQEEHDYDITPTTNRYPLPESSFEAVVAGAALGGTAGAALGRHDIPSPIGTPVSNSPRNLHNHGALPTPDPSMAPGGNLYSTTKLDPRLILKLEQAPPETQLRSDAVNRAVSAESSVAPPPPPKDIPVQKSTDSDSEYFPKPTVPLKQRTLGRVDGESLEPPRRPEILPTLSTDTRSYDEENDKLRKEIVKSLSPRPSDAGQNHESMLEDEVDNGPLVTQGRESTYLPTEYDNYWASTAEEEEPVPAVTGAASRHDDLPTQPAENVPSVAPESQIKREISPPIIPPLSSRRLEEPQRQSRSNRFSWEEGSENVSVGPHEEPNAVAGNTDDDRRNIVDEPTGASTEAKNISQPVTSIVESSPSQLSPLGSGRSFEGADTTIDRDFSVGHYIGSEAALVAGGAAVAGAAVATHGPQSPGSAQRRLSLAEEKDPQVSSYPVSPTPPEDEHPANSPTPYFSPSATQLSHAPPSTVSPVASPVKPPFSPTSSKLLAFRDIVAIQSTQQRIETFDETRHRWANMDSGLTDWMAKLQSQYPEHANASGSWAGSRMSAPTGSSNSRFGKPPVGGAPPLQEPYYRQYLNASPTTPSTPTRPGPAPGPSLQSGSQQSFSPAGNKLSSHQVQTKGKELLHSAGIFGGKAGKAGKGLLAKGKNKLRGTGGGDKTSPPPKPKAERRTSWGLPLSLSRSAGPPDSPTQKSKDSTPVPTPERSRVRPDATSERSSPVPQLPPLASEHSLGTMSGAPPVTNLPHHDEPASSQQVPELKTAAEESRDTLAPPAPIGKYQPSWDPFNATPIAEEEGFQYEERQKPPRQSFSESRRRQESLAAPADNLSRSDQSSSDAHFYDAHENSADIPSDWVMVTPDPEYKDPVVEEDATAEPEVTANPEAEDRVAVVGDKAKAEPEPEVKTEVESERKKSVDAATTSILDRPRGNLDVPTTSILDRPRGSFDASTTSILNQPLGSSFGAASTPTPNAFPSTSPPQTSTRVAVVAQPTAPARTQPVPPTSAVQAFTPAPVATPTQYPPQPDPQPQPEEQKGSSFLPPIRRTSNFGIGFGPRQAKPRFPIDDDSDDTPRLVAQQKAPENRQASVVAPAGAAAGIAAIVHHELNREAGQLAPQALETRQSLSSQPANTMDQRAQYQGPNYQPQQPPVLEPSRRVPPIETSFNQQSPIFQPESTRQPLVQAGSSQYSSQQGSTRPPLTQASSSDYSQHTLTSEPKLQQQHKFVPPRATDVAFRPQNFTESHVEWRPNRPKVAPGPAPAPVSPSYWKEQDIPPPRSSLDQQSQQPRNSWEPQRGRGYSGSSQSYTQRPDGQGEKAPWNGSPQQQRPFEQPPSAAQRYPDLFRPENPVPGLPGESADLPAHYYQGPLPRSAAFLPRQQTNEYQLPGVGPPTDEPRSPRRNSGFLKDIGGKLSRGSSRERDNSISKEGTLPSPTRPFDSRGNEYAESEAPSEGALEQKKRRSGFFGLKRGSTAGLGPPVSQESVIAHHPGSHLGSRTDLLATPQPSPTAQHERKRSIFGSHLAEPKTKPNKLTRASTGTLDEPGKRKRFSSGLSGLFGKSSPSTRGPVQERPQATRELSYAERQPLESPGLSPHVNLRAPVQPQTPPQNTTASNQQRRVLSKLTSNPSQSPRQQSKTRRPSGSGILGGLMGRRSQQLERGGSDDSRSQGSQPQLVPQPLPVAQTYTDLQDQEWTGPPPVEPQRQPRPALPQDQPMLYQGNAQSMPTPDRGRRVTREQQYDSVPIPGGYSLVRGQGAMPVSTEYDPRGYNQQQVDPRYAQPRAQGFYNQAQGYQNPNGQQYESPGSQQQGGKPPKPSLSPIETYNNYNPHTETRSLSREDVIARSPPKSPEGQQRPYQLSLPDEDSEGGRPAKKEIPIFPSPSTRNQSLKHDAIQRLQQPTLRHPESPAGYPLPDDTVFSPINPAAESMPLPPAPRWPGPQLQHQFQHVNQEGHQHSNSLTQSLSTMDVDLDRSNTRRTAASAVSGISDPQNPIQSVRGSLNVPGKNGQSQDEVGNVNVMRSSPTPPSPMGGTPEREVSPEPTPRMGGGEIKTTDLHIRPQSGSDDLYSASPRLPKNVQFPSSSRTESNLGPGANGQVKRIVSESSTRPTEPKDEVNVNRRGGSERARGLRRAQEEKILIGENGEEIEVEIDENEPPKMSATSFPGQEWNPYAHGGWDDGYD